MDHYPRLICWIGSAFVLCLLGSACELPGTNNMVTGYDANSGVEMEVSIPAVTQAGQPVELNVRISNRSPKYWYWAETDGASGFEFTLENKEKTALTLTPLGQKVVGKFPMLTRELTLHPLEPGESREWKVDLGAYCQFSPGNYTISAFFPFDLTRDTIDLEVKNLEFMVK